MSWWCPSPISVLSAWSPVGTTLVLSAWSPGSPLVLSVWIPVGTPLGPLSTLSQYENKNEVLPQCEVKKKDLSLNACNCNVPSRVLETFNPLDPSDRDAFLKPFFLSWEQGEDF